MKIRFDAFILDLDTRQLTADGREIHLAPQAYALLACLVLDRPKALSKAELLERIWPNTFVAEANLSNLISEVREALHDRPRAPRYIRTVHGFGYAFSGDAAVVADPDEPATSASLCWLEWGAQRFPLGSGAHVVGRDPDVDVRLDASTVSRRHARLLISAHEVLLEDLDSKNGTFRGEERVQSPVQLSDGDALRIGSLRLTFHRRATVGSTETQIDTH